MTDYTLSEKKFSDAMLRKKLNSPKSPYLSEMVKRRQALSTNKKVEQINDEVSRRDSINNLVILNNTSNKDANAEIKLVKKGPFKNGYIYIYIYM